MRTVVNPNFKRGWLWPPGTGKTHTIANIINHMLATGRRVLVVSHGETALRVIQEQLPEGVRDLAISVTCCCPGGRGSTPFG